MKSVLWSGCQRPGRPWRCRRRAGQARRGYANAAVLTGEQHAIVDRLAANLMGEITDASMTVMATLQSALFGRVEPDVYRRVGLEQVAAQQAAGRGVNASVPSFVQALRREGVRAFTDKAGRDWSLHTYCTMVSRTTSRQAEVLAVLTARLRARPVYDLQSRHHLCAVRALRGPGVLPQRHRPGLPALGGGVREGRPGRAGHTGKHLAEYTPQLPPCAAALDGGGPDR